MTDLTERQRTAALLLAAGKRLSEVMDGLQIPKTTLWEWRQQPAFKAELQTIQDQLRRDLYTELVTGAQTMLDVLWSIATDAKAPANARIKAAVDWLDKAGFVKGYAYEEPLDERGEMKKGVDPAEALAKLDETRSRLEAIVAAREAA